MSKRLKRILIGVAVVAAVIFGVLRYIRVQTKSHSPEETATFYLDGQKLEIELFYSRPYKKERVIFGGLVPYNKVWRTGANEATTFTINKDIGFGGKAVKAGKYTLWSMPGAEQWTVYLNSKMYSWGIDMDGNAQRDPAFDVAAITVPVEHVPEAVEQFTMSISVDSVAPALMMMWDDVMINVPISY
ncbi:MAG TPA: DUF2911 domain-containing protein [Flavobacteriales bacterium]|nr:DUF2911 domain-containing protein [Flavobacteriales bacterium]